MRVCQFSASNYTCVINTNTEQVKLTSFVGVRKCMRPVISIAHVESHRQDFLALRSCETIGTGSSAFLAHKSTYCLRRLNAMGFLPPAKGIK